MEQSKNNTYIPTLKEYNERDLPLYYITDTHHVQGTIFFKGEEYPTHVYGYAELRKQLTLGNISVYTGEEQDMHPSEERISILGIILIIVLTALVAYAFIA